MSVQSQNSSSLISSIYKSRKIILDLMKKQGYNVDDYENFSINEVNSMKINNQMDMLLEKTDNSPPPLKTLNELMENKEYAAHIEKLKEMQPEKVLERATKAYNKRIENESNVVGGAQVNRKIYIRYFLLKTINRQHIQEMIDDLFNLEETLTKNDTLMIIVKEDMNETVTNLLKHIWEQDGIFIIIQSIKRLQFNILEHALVPPHRVLNNKELDIIKKRYNIMDDSQFPDISRFDPVAQIIGIRPGQVCEIIRPSKTAISAFYYRICI